MDDREDYAEPDLGPGCEPPRATIVVVAFAVAVLVGCGTLAILFGYLVGEFR
jgi:hypothetical protein